MEPSIIINNNPLIVNPVDGAPSPRRLTMDKVATFGVILGSGLLLFSLAALSISAISFSATLVGLSLLLKQVVSKIDDCVTERVGDGEIKGSRLSIAASKSEVIKSRILLFLGANPNNTLCGSYSPPLNLAIERCNDYKNVHIIRALLRAGAEVNRIDPTTTAPYTPLSCALRPDTNLFADLAAAELLIFGANPNCPAEPFNTALYKMALLGKDYLVSALLIKGAEIDVPGKEDGSSPLFGAIEGCHVPVVQILLKNRANRTLSRGGQTPLEYAQQLRADMAADDERIPRIERIIELLSSAV